MCAHASYPFLARTTQGEEGTGGRPLYRANRSREDDARLRRSAEGERSGAILVGGRLLIHARILRRKLLFAPLTVNR